jgi:Flp pilus assembly pilin Flp
MTATIGKLNMNTICKMLRDQRGATTIECGLIVALIAIAAVSALQGNAARIPVMTNVRMKAGSSALTITIISSPWPSSRLAEPDPGLTNHATHLLN